ncbi:NAD(P)H-hydrate dehydratase [Arenimonas caeni]|uniref:Bifunctional NAD(P)H-hydrate repair enzyme n=1 Tax=Arenimonas caeni TaxID=2058085 RepID=A0A2P6M712_9GAMM|nr:NAD(P)H-hydrate dehydratase [Arenimonas caeni]PRH81794.1 bifunctional ADP-dependent NAD(P)H-hydrate dehydratase/NAD(P)H-hydrate epimerase [Arenimonas caeni]
MADMLPLYRAAQVRAMDRRAIEQLGVPAWELMQRAGAAAWRLLRGSWPQARRIGVACGPGNNGGDGYVLARLARAEGFEVHVVSPPGAHPRRDPARKALAAWREAGGRVESFDGMLPEVDVWVDAIYGIGLARAPSDAVRSLIERINASHRPVLALDVPSGLDADTGHAPGIVVEARLTLSFIAPKQGLYTGMARDVDGDVRVDRLDLPPIDTTAEPPSAWLVRDTDLSAWLAPRHANAHKGEHGHVLCVGGELGMGGAVRLCAEAALRTGVGLASVATRSAGVAALVAARPEAMTHAVEDSAALAPLLGRATVVAVGPGLGQGAWGRALLGAAVACGKPLVLDADALNLLAAAPRPVPQAILTPHPGEAGRLLGMSTADVQADRYAAASALATRYQAVVVLKGAGTVVAAPARVPVVIGAGNPGMATGGMGDVLSGVVAALLAQHLPPFEAAVAGALLHAAAGDAAARVDGERGLLPSDLFPHLRRLANPAWN